MLPSNRQKPTPQTALQVRLCDLYTSLNAIWDVAAKLAKQIDEVPEYRHDLPDEECKNALLFSEAVLRNALCEAVRIQMLGASALGASAAAAKACWLASRNIGQCDDN